jgi:hypothetical protein
MDPAAFRASLVRIGFSIPASAYIVSPQGQGILFDDLVDLANEDISTLCSALRRPGGMIPDPQDPAAFIRNPGIPVSALAERRLKIIIYLSRLFARRINRTLTPAMITLVEIRNAQTLMERDAAHKNPSEAPKIGDAKAMMEFLEDPDSYLSNFHGEDDVPFPYIYRTEVTPPLDATDARVNYISVEAEMIARAPHTLPAYNVDNAALAKVLKEMVSDFKDAITWARDSFRNRDGRSVMQDWMLHFCGTARQETVEITAEATMNNTFYKGEKPRFTFVLYTNIHRGCHNEINSVRRLAQPPTAEMDELLKVRKYLKGIEAPEMAAAVAAVKASPTIRLNFDVTADFLTGFVTQNTPSVRVASVTHGGQGRGGTGRGGRERQDRDRQQGRGRGRGGGRGRGRGRGRGGRGGSTSTQRGGGGPGTYTGTVTDRYYSPEEYATFSPENMNQLFEIRAARDNARSVSQVSTAAQAATTAAAIVAAIQTAAQAANPATTGQLTPVNPGSTSQRSGRAGGAQG